MNEQLALLIEIQGLDSRIIEKDTLIRGIPAKLDSLEKSKSSALADFERLKQRCDSIKQKQKDKERELEDVDRKIEKLKSRTSEIKTNKEYQAHLKEIEAAEKERYEIENAILALMEELETQGNVLGAAKENADRQKKEIDELKRRLDEEAARTKAEMDSLNAERAKLKKSIDGEAYALYMTVLETTRGLAVVGAKAEICEGCNMHIPPQLFVEVKKNEEIMQCPQCRRILYYRDEEKGPASL